MKGNLVQTLNEMSIKSVDFNDIIDDNYVTDIIDQLVVDDKEEDVENLRIHIRCDFEENFDEIYYKFVNDLIDENDEIIIYRKIAIVDNWLNHIEKEGKRLRIYWPRIPA